MEHMLGTGVLMLSTRVLMIMRCVMVRYVTVWQELHGMVQYVVRYNHIDRQYLFEYFACICLFMCKNLQFMKTKLKIWKSFYCHLSAITG
jgi:hypothetical protein